tara:strand:+ start:8617 stop:9420 length:804 start_codon:yes stop_codon:yes gene_type:complete
MISSLPAVRLKLKASGLQIGDTCPGLEPNVTDSCVLLDPNGDQVGLFLKELPKDLINLVTIADQELRSERVKKSVMERITQYTLPNGKRGAIRLKQYSAQLGSMAPKPHLRLPYPRSSPLHIDPKAVVFCKAMLKAGRLAMGLVNHYIPEVHRHHLKRVDQRLPSKWRFSTYFSSTISNCNIAAPIHQDNANIKGAINLIITKRQNSKGGNLHVPDFDATFDQTNNSLLVYPAWRNRHGVTPIIPTHQGGYRNSHVWYALDSFAALG